MEDEDFNPAEILKTIRNANAPQQIRPSKEQKQLDVLILKKTVLQAQEETD